MKKQKEKKRQAADPNRAREANKYQNPIASREFIHQLLVDEGAPLSMKALIRRLGFQGDPDLQEALRRRLGAMIRDAQLIKNRNGDFLPVDETDLKSGRVSAHPDGYGFLEMDDGAGDIYLSGRQMRQVLHGDRVVVCITGLDRRGRREGRIVDVIERANLQLVGRLLSEKGVWFIAPDNRRIHQDLMIPQNELAGAQNGDMVIADVVEQPTRKHPPVGAVRTVLGQHLKAGMETDVAIASHDIPHHWPDEVIDYVAQYAAEVPDADKAGRRDIRKLPLVTIDGEDARDFDDAVYCEKREDGWRLFVAIADVSHYVQTDSALDTEAQKRGTSVYFPSRVVPMLPEALSNGLCSLNPQVDRLCMLCEMTLDSSGALKRTRFAKAVMRSHQRFTYTDVASILVEKDKALRKQHKALLPHLQNLYSLYKVLAKQRKKRGAIEFESTETRMIFDDQQKISEIVPTVRNDAHKLIEECMILANIAAAAYLENKKMPALYRVHSSPKLEKLEDLRAFLALRSLSLGGGDSPTAQDYAKLVKSMADRPDAGVIQTVMLRSMQQAVYQQRNEGHFGLALEQYAHFTSPIRRYPDLLVHRAIMHSVQRGKVADYRYNNEQMAALGEMCSMTERRADDATRDVSSWLKCEYMQDHVGDEFDGVVSAVTSFGLFVQLKGIFVEGLVHVTSLGSDYYHFDQVAHALVGEHTGTRFRLGDSLRVRVSAVNLEERKIDFQPAESDARSGKKGTRKGKGQGSEKANEKRSGKGKGKGRKKGNKKHDNKQRETVGDDAVTKAEPVVRKPSSKKVAAKKAAAKKTARKTTAKKTTAKKTAKKKTTGKKIAAKKTATKKVVSKKTAGKKPLGKKSWLEKSCARKA